MLIKIQNSSKIKQMSYQGNMPCEYEQNARNRPLRSHHQLPAHLADRQVQPALRLLYAGRHGLPPQARTDAGRRTAHAGARLCRTRLQEFRLTGGEPTVRQNSSKSAASSPTRPACKACR